MRAQLTAAGGERPARTAGCRSPRWTGRARRGARVLDAGCGFGETSLELAKLTGDLGSVVGFDCIDGALAVARTDAMRAKASNVDFVCGDAQTHRWDERFDHVFARFGT